MSKIQINKYQRLQNGCALVPELVTATVVARNKLILQVTVLFLAPEEKPQEPEPEPVQEPEPVPEEVPPAEKQPEKVSHNIFLLFNFS